MPITTTSPRIISLRFISNKFPRLLAEREIIANASILVRISPRTDGKGTKNRKQRQMFIGLFLHRNDK